MGIGAVIGLGLHYWYMPKFPAYLYQVIGENVEDINIKYACGGK